jgi:hypothetical protein
MKRKIAAFVPAVLLAAALSPAAAPAAEVGVFFGVGASGLHGSGLGGAWQDKIGMQGGFALTFPFSSYFALQTELYFVQKGAVNSVPGSGGTLRSTMDIGVLEIPLLAKVSLPLGESVIRPYVIGGASVGLKLWSSLAIVLDDGTGYLTQIRDATVTGMYIVSPSYVAGIGTDFRAENSRINVEIRYTRTMGSVTKEGATVTSSVLSLSAGYYF